jgi:hypothetical protein
MAVAVAPETHGAVLLSDELPSVPALLSAQGLEEEGAAEAEAWRESWDLSEEEGTRLRARIYPSAARRLLPALGDAGVEDLLARNEENLRAVEAVAHLLLSEPVLEAFQRSQDLHAQARESMDRADGEMALGMALESVDALREVSPEHVGRGLVDEAELAFRRIRSTEAYSLEELTRIRRLTIGAREALEAGDYPRAIRRAYYACQLLGVSPP